MKPSRTQEDIGHEPHRCAPKSIEEIDFKILCRNDHFCVVDKPADVRMDGNFDITVEKLLIRSLPEYKGSSVSTKDIKWIHQLDFATSGVLCVGLTREGAAAASSCFEHREVEKLYLSVLSGRIDLSRWSFDDYHPVEEILCPYKKKKTEAKDSGIDEPATWQDLVRKQNLDTFFNILHSVDINTISKEFLEDVEKVKAISYDAYSKGPKLRKRLRKLIKSLGIEVNLLESSHEVKEPSIDQLDMAAVSRALEGEELLEVINSYQNRTPPAIFRPHNTTDKLIIRVPVAEISNDFRMEPGHDNNMGKACETELTILAFATYQGEEVTKVLFRPRTGRRHQLRIHSLVLGHPIVGDYTYNSLHRSAMDGHRSQAKAERMMLHAHSLRIPKPTTGKCSRQFKAFLDSLGDVDNDGERDSRKGKFMIDCCAEDPFPVVETILRPNVIKWC